MSDIVAFDSETHLIAPGCPAPQSVCWTFADESNEALLVPWEGASPYARLRTELDRGNTLVGHNVTFDAAIACVESPDLLQRFFDGFESGQVRCTMIREQLIRISEGTGRFIVVADDEDNDTVERTRFDLASCSWRWLRHFVKKQDTFRLKYGTLYKVPLNDWPETAKSYALEDARITRRVYLAQDNCGPIADEIPQHIYAWALKLVSLWGVRTDGEAVARLKAALTKAQTEAIMALLPKGLFRIGGTKKAPKYVRTMAEIRAKVSNAYAKLQEPVPLTKKGAVSTATKTLRESGDTDLLTLANALGAMKLLSSFIPVLESGVNQPICAEYNVLVESGRTSCRKPNMQQLPRGTKDYRPRECFVARPGKAWVSVDYEMAELVGQGQMCLDLVGFSVLAEQINAGQKPILAFASKLLGLSYDATVRAYENGDPEAKARRQDSKAAMYGLPGGMKAKKLWQTMTAFGNDVDFGRAKWLERQWQVEYPEFPRFFDFVRSQVGREYGDTGTITQLRSGRVRGGVDFNAAANSFFQGLVADAAKSALARCVRESFLDPQSPLYGAHVVVFAHDEIIVECDVLRVHDVGYRVAEIMKAEAARFMPNVKMGAEPAAMLRWRKDSYPKFDENRRLVPCDG